VGGGEWIMALRREGGFFVCSCLKRHLREDGRVGSGGSDMRDGRHGGKRGAKCMTGEEGNDMRIQEGMSGITLWFQSKCR
jgi:hypothetical protein